MATSLGKQPVFLFIKCGGFNANAKVFIARLARDQNWSMIGSIDNCKASCHMHTSTTLQYWCTCTQLWHAANGAHLQLHAVGTSYDHLDHPCSMNCSSSYSSQAVCCFGIFPLPYSTHATERPPQYLCPAWLFAGVPWDTLDRLALVWAFLLAMNAWLQPAVEHVP